MLRGRFWFTLSLLAVLLPASQASLLRCHSCSDGGKFFSLTNPQDSEPLLLTEPAPGTEKAPSCVAGKDKWTVVDAGYPPHRCVEIILESVDILGARGIMTEQKLKEVFKFDTVPMAGCAVKPLPGDGLELDARVCVCTTDLCNSAPGIGPGSFSTVLLLPAFLVASVTRFLA